MSKIVDLSKKALSVFLALLMVQSLFAANSLLFVGANAEEALTELSDNSGTSLKIRTQILKEIDGEWTATDNVIPGDDVKARVFIETDYYASSGDIILFYNNDFFEDSYPVAKKVPLVVNESETSFTYTYGVEGEMSKLPKDKGLLKKFVNYGYITQDFADKHEAIVFLYSFSLTSECQIITGDEWFAEFDLKVREDATGSGDFFTVQELVMNPDEGLDAYINVSKQSEKSTLCSAAISMFLWRADVTLESNPVRIESEFSGDCGDNLVWAFDETTGELVISGTGDMSDFSDDVPWSEYKEEICSVVIEDGVTSIGDSAFEGCEGVSEIVIPGSVTDIAQSAFSGCKGLINITVDSSNTVYSSDENGVLFNKEKTELLQYPAGNTSETYTVPDGVSHIASYAFEGCDNIKSIDIPDSVEIIDSALFECGNLTDIYYDGTEERWNAVQGLAENDNITVHFKQKTEIVTGDITLECYDDIFEADVVVQTQKVNPEAEDYDFSLLGNKMSPEVKYEITICDRNGNEVQPSEGEVTVKIKIPEGTDITEQDIIDNNVMVVHISKDGSVQDEIYGADRLRIENGYLVFEVTHFSYFLLCVKDNSPNDDPNDDPVVEVKNPSVKIRNNPGTATIKYGDVLRLTVDTSDMTEDMQVVWYVNGNEKGNGEYFEAKITEDIEVFAKITDSKGNVVKDASGNEIVDSQKVAVKTSLWLRFVSFFKDLFRMNRVVIQSVFKGIL